MRSQSSSQFGRNRMLLVGATTVAMVLALWWLVEYRPPRSRATTPTPEQWEQHIPLAILSVSVVVLINIAFMVQESRKRRMLPEHEKDWRRPDPHAGRSNAPHAYVQSGVMRRALARTPSIPAGERAGSGDPTPLGRIAPEPVEAQGVPLKVIGITIGMSLVGLLFGAQLADPDHLLTTELWKPVLFATLPWLPVFFHEAVWKYESYGFYALLYLFTLLQVGHLGEHATQVLQLVISGGNPAASHGVFGVFDREYVHFVWDSLVWIGVGALVVRLGTHNRWLLVSLVAASFHEVEHIFLTYLYQFENAFWAAGGDTGLLAKGGLIGTPLPRPYLHFAYNVIVVLPLVIAFLDETRRAYNLYLARALPSMAMEERAETTGMLEKVRYKAGETIIRQGDRADRFYVVGDGEVEVVRENPHGEQRLAILHEGHFFGEIGLLTGHPRTATVRAHTDVDVFVLEANEFAGVLSRSTGAQADVDSELSERFRAMRGAGVDVDGIVRGVPAQSGRSSTPGPGPTRGA